MIKILKLLRFKFKISFILKFEFKARILLRRLRVKYLR